MFFVQKCGDVGNGVCMSEAMRMFL